MTFLSSDEFNEMQYQPGYFDYTCGVSKLLNVPDGPPQTLRCTRTKSHSNRHEGITTNREGPNYRMTWEG